MKKNKKEIKPFRNWLKDSGCELWEILLILIVLAIFIALLTISIPTIVEYFYLPQTVTYMLIFIGVPMTINFFKIMNVGFYEGEECKHFIELLFGWLKIYIVVLFCLTFLLLELFVFLYKKIIFFSERKQN
jgi:hypothetical protein